MELKVGDRVRGFDAGLFTGIVFEITSKNAGTIKRDDGETGNGCNIEGYGYGWAFSNLSDYSLEVINTTKNMNLKQKFALVFKGEPERSFIKAGVMNTDESLTSDGIELVMRFVLSKFKDDFKKEIVDPILAEDNKE